MASIFEIVEEKNGWCKWYNSSTTKMLFFNTNVFFYCKQIVILLIVIWLTCICIQSSIFLSFRACLPWWWVTFIFSSMCLPVIPFVWRDVMWLVWYALNYLFWVDCISCILFWSVRFMLDFCFIFIYPPFYVIYRLFYKPGFQIEKYGYFSHHEIR